MKRKYYQLEISYFNIKERDGGGSGETGTWTGNGWGDGYTVNDWEIVNGNGFGNGSKYEDWDGDGFGFGIGGGYKDGSGSFIIEEDEVGDDE